MIFSINHIMTDMKMYHSIPTTLYYNIIMICLEYSMEQNNILNHNYYFKHK